MLRSAARCPRYLLVRQLCSITVSPSRTEAARLGLTSFPGPIDLQKRDGVGHWSNPPTGFFFDNTQSSPVRVVKSGRTIIRHLAMAIYGTGVRQRRRHVFRVMRAQDSSRFIVSSSQAWGRVYETARQT